jgi:gliding motility-associated-like protein
LQRVDYNLKGNKTGHTALKRMTKIFGSLIVISIGMLNFFGSQAQILNKDPGFETDNWQDNWARDTYTPCSPSQYKIEIVTDKARNGNRSLHLEQTACYRTEINTEPYSVGQLQWGREYWIGFSLYLEDWANNPADWNSLVQCRPAPGNLNWSCDPGTNGFTLFTDNWTNNNEIKFHAEIHNDAMNKVPTGGAIGNVAWSRPAPSNRWTDFVINLKFSTGNDGFIRLWVDGELVVDLKGPNILYRDQCGVPREPWMFLKFGTYKEYAHRTRRSVYYDDIKIAGSQSNYNDVAPEADQGNANNPPSINILNPVPEHIFLADNDIQVEVDARDPDGDLTAVRYYLNSTFIGESGSDPYTYTIPGMEPGTWELIAEAVDAQDTRASDTVTFYTNRPPEIAITTPGGDTTVSAGDDVLVAVQASDYGGEIERISYFLDSTLLAEMSQGPYEHLIQNFPAGSHTIAVVAQDNQGLRTTATILVNTNSPPQVSFLQPQSGGVYGPDEMIELEAGVVDTEENISSVFFYIGDSLIAEDNNAPYTATIQGLSSGPHRFIVVATDGFGLHDSDTANIIINYPPEISLVQPNSDTIITEGGDVPVIVNAVDQEGEALEVSFYLDSTLLSSDTDAPYQTVLQSMPYGRYTITATVTDDVGSSASVSFDLFVNAVPTVSIESPAIGQVLPTGNTVEATVAVVDPDNNLATVYWYLNDSLAEESTQSPYATVFNDLPAGTWQLVAVATDIHGAQGADTVSFIMNQPPSVAITQPSNDAVVADGDDILVQTNAFDPDGTVSSVTFYMDSVMLGEITSAPYEFLILNISNGHHFIVVVTTDDLGLTSTASVQLFANAGPSVQIESPDAHSVFSTEQPIELRTTVSDPDDNLDMVSFYLNDSLLTELSSPPYTLTIGSLSSGHKTFQARATDSYGSIAYDSIHFEVSQPPLVSFAEPAMNAVVNDGDDVLISLNADDTDGSVVSVDIYMDSIFITKLTGAEWDHIIHNIPFGQHVITAIATDDLGLTTEISVEIFANAVSQISIVAPLENQVFTTDQDIEARISVTDPDNNLSNVSFFLNDSLVQQIAQEPFSITFNIPVHGTWQLVAVAVDAYNATASDTVTFMTNHPPVVNILEPSDGITIADGDDILVQADVSDPGGSVASVAFFMDSILLGEVAGAPYAFLIQNISNGHHTVAVVATDDLGLTATASIHLFANGSPAIAIQSPADGQVIQAGDPVEAAATVSDPDNNLAHVSWYLNDSLAEQNTQAPYTALFGNLPAGTWQLVAIATDAGGAQAADTVNFIINTPPSVAIAQPANDAVVAEGDDVLVQADASDTDGTVASVAFYMDSVLLGEVAGAPYAFLIQDIPTGHHTLTVVATDDRGLESDTSIKVMVNGAPTVAFTSPTSNQVYGTAETIEVRVEAGDPNGNLTTVSYFLNGTRIADISESPFSIAIDALDPGSWQLVATATDNVGASASDTVYFVVNQSPTVTIVQPENGTMASEGDDILVTVNAADEGGSVASVAFYMDSVLLGEDTTAPYEFLIHDIPHGNHTITATAIDDLGLTSSTSVTLLANSSPHIAISIPIDQGVYRAGIPIYVQSNVSDAEGNLESVMYYLNGNLQEEVLEPPYSTVLQNLTPGPWELAAVASDAMGMKDSDTINFYINEAPVVSFIEPLPQSLYASGGDVFVKIDAFDESGEITDVRLYMDGWRLADLSGPQYEFTIRGIPPGKHVLSAVATDNLGLSTGTSVTISTNTEPHLVIISPDDGAIIQAHTPFEITVDVFDIDDNVEYVEYTIQGQAPIASFAAPYTIGVDGLPPGTHGIIALVTDNAEATHADTVEIVVNAPPTVDVGPDIMILSPSDSVTLSGSATDPDGTIATLRWSKISGPSNFLMTDPNVATVAVTSLVPGVYVFQMEAIDDHGGAGTDEVVITVGEETSNIAPIADAGNDVSVILPQRHATLSGTATDEDGNIDRIEWVQVEGPSTASMFNANTYSPTVDNLVEGSYLFQLTVTDDRGASGSDFLVVTVLAGQSIVADGPDHLDASKYFSPDGNGINDEWIIRNLHDFVNPELYVYNRAGQLVFESKNYSNNWGGSMSGGSPLPDGDYYYIFKADNLAAPLNGAIRLLRAY